MTLYHGTSSGRWARIQADALLRRVPMGDDHLSLTDSLEVAQHFAEMAIDGDGGGDPVILAVDASGLDTEPFVSGFWDDCEWERETACFEDVPIERVRIEPYGSIVKLAHTRA